MKLDIYQSATNNGKFLLVPAGTKIEGKPFPGTLDADLRKVLPFPGSADFEAGDTRAGMTPADTTEVIRQVSENGFAVRVNQFRIITLNCG